jgi:hypothetical protein
MNDAELMLEGTAKLCWIVWEAFIFRHMGIAPLSLSCAVSSIDVTARAMKDNDKAINIERDFRNCIKPSFHDHVLKEQPELSRKIFREIVSYAGTVLK